MTQLKYELGNAAETDLRDIIRYTRKKWGDTQVRRYINELEQCIARLVAGQGLVRDMSELYPKLRMAHCKHHYVFYLPRAHAPTLIVAILHERMDVMTRLAARLDETGYS